MNERIKQLAEQATQKFSRFGERDSWEKLFAELIVQECAEFINRWERFQVEQEFHHGGVWCGGGKELKQHFGFES